MLTYVDRRFIINWDVQVVGDLFFGVGEETPFRNSENCSNGIL